MKKFKCMVCGYVAEGNEAAPFARLLKKSLKK